MRVSTVTPSFVTTVKMVNKRNKEIKSVARKLQMQVYIDIRIAIYVWINNRI